MCFFLWLSSISLYICTVVYPVINGYLGCFHVLAIVNSPAINIGVHESFSVLVLSEYMPRTGIAGSYGDFIPFFFFFKDSPYCLP